MISVRARGNFRSTEQVLRNITSLSKTHKRILDKYGLEGVRILSENTPVKTGKTASSWYYELVQTTRGINISWKNSNVVDGTPIVLLIHYGHGTKNGGYVKGLDFINPSLKPIFDKISIDLWKEVTR